MRRTSSEAICLEKPACRLGNGDRQRRSASRSRCPIRATPGDENTAFKVPTYPVGRLKYFVIWPTHGSRPGTARAGGRRGATFSTSAASTTARPAGRRRKSSTGGRSTGCSASSCSLIGPLLFPESQKNALLTAGATFGIFAAINVCWTLIIGTAGIFSLATYAVVGTAAFVTSLLSIQHGPAVVCAAADRRRASGLPLAS